MITNTSYVRVKKVNTLNIFISRWGNKLRSYGTLLRNEYKWAAIHHSMDEFKTIILGEISQTKKSIHVKL